MSFVKASKIAAHFRYNKKNENERYWSRLKFYTDMNFSHENTFFTLNFLIEWADERFIRFSKEKKKKGKNDVILFDLLIFQQTQPDITLRVFLK